MSNSVLTENGVGLLAFGLNHRTAPVDMRERLAFAEDSLDVALQAIKAEAELNEIAILATCNRTDLYCATTSTNLPRIHQWLCESRKVQLQQLQSCCYEYWDQQAVAHMMRVASGLDSMVVGEPQILGQLKTAYTLAKEAQTLGPNLGRMFETAFSVAKQVRTETSIGVNPVSVASAAVALAKHIFSDLRDSKVLLIGAGETVDLLARHLQQQQVKEMIVANRTVERAAQLAREFDAIPIGLDEIADVLAKVDIVVSSTAAPLPILGKGMVEKALKKRRHSPIFMIDLAVPRDIEPEVGDLDDIYLYTVDDLQATVEENRKARAEVAQEAEQIVRERSELFMNQLKQLGATDTIKQFRTQIDGLREIELQKALQLLAAGADPEQVVARLSRNLANKIMHEPSLAIKKASAEGRMEQLRWTHELFNLQQPPEDKKS